MKMIGTIVRHIKFGEGIVSEVHETNGKIYIQFGDEIKVFSFPQCFKQFISVSDDTLKAELSALIAEDDRKKQEQAVIEAAEKRKSWNSQRKMKLYRRQKSRGHTFIPARI